MSHIVLTHTLTHILLSFECYVIFRAPLIIIDLFCYCFMFYKEIVQERTSVVSSGTANQPEKVTTVPPQQQTQPPPLTQENVKCGSWYYNNEEDKYSFCEDTESESSGGARYTKSYILNSSWH